MKKRNRNPDKNSPDKSRKNTSKELLNRGQRIFSPLWLLMFVVFLFILSSHSLRSTEIAYSEFLSALKSGNIEEVTVREDRLTGTMVNEPTASENGKEAAQNRFTTVRVDDGIAEQLAEHDVEFEGAIESNWLWTIFLWTIGGIIVFSIISAMLQGSVSKGGMGPGSPFTLGKNSEKVSSIP